MAAAIVIGALLTACSATSSDTTEPADTTLATPTTAIEPSTTVVSPTTTLATTSTTGGGGGVDGAEGSGCTPGEGDLPDGLWYGEVASLTADEIEFDLACWFTGDAAVRAAQEDGEESPPPNDYYVRNTNPATRLVPVGAGTTVVWFPEFGDPSSETTIAYTEWVESIGERGDFTPGIWIEVSNGEVTAITEQWVP
ncbi:MAG: hypothetical protein WAL25_12480 [Acidimicrobiia bacterium]